MPWVRIPSTSYFFPLFSVSYAVCDVVAQGVVLLSGRSYHGSYIHIYGPYDLRVTYVMVRDVTKSRRNHVFVARMYSCYPKFRPVRGVELLQLIRENG